jgi:peptidoglycan/LPS O-acetylase OafA/YrhL
LVLWPTWLIGAVIAERHLVGLYLFASHRSLIILVMGALCVVSQVFQPLSFLSFDFVAVAFAVLLDSYALRAKPLHWSAVLLAFVGTASYSVYLIHQPVLPYAVRGMRSLGIYGPGLQIVIGFPLFVPAMAIVGWCSYLLLEKNGMRLGRALRLRGRDVDQRTVLSPPV